MKNKQKGFIGIGLMIWIIVGLALAGTTVYVVKKNSNNDQAARKDYATDPYVEGKANGVSGNGQAGIAIDEPGVHVAAPAAGIAIDEPGVQINSTATVPGVTANVGGQATAHSDWKSYTWSYDETTGKKLSVQYPADWEAKTGNYQDGQAFLSLEAKPIMVGGASIYNSKQAIVFEKMASSTQCNGSPNMTVNCIGDVFVHVYSTDSDFLKTYNSIVATVKVQ